MRRGIDMTGFENADNIVLGRVASSELTEIQHRTGERYWHVRCKLCSSVRIVRGVHIRSGTMGPCKACTMKRLHAKLRGVPRVARERSVLELKFPRVVDPVEESISLLPQIEQALRNAHITEAFKLVTRLIYRLNKLRSK
jgi:hypothetical protein